jgi:hypothetical protein
MQSRPDQDLLSRCAFILWSDYMALFKSGIVKVRKNRIEYGSNLECSLSKNCNIVSRVLEVNEPPRQAPCTNPFTSLSVHRRTHRA